MLVVCPGLLVKNIHSFITFSFHCQLLLACCGFWSTSSKWNSFGIICTVKNVYKFELNDLMAQNPWGNVYSFVRLYKNHLNKHLSSHVWTGQVLCGMPVISDFALRARIRQPGLFHTHLGSLLTSWCNSL